MSLCSPVVHPQHSVCTPIITFVLLTQSWAPWVSTQECALRAMALWQVPEGVQEQG